MSPKHHRLLALAPLVAVLAACSDRSPTAPAAPAPSAAALVASKGGSPTTSAVQTQTFVYDGHELKQAFGDGHEIQFDAKAVCDPATSGYGPDVWDRPCTPLKGPITFTVTSWRDANGRAQVSFSPDVRFAPGTTEILYLNDNPGQAKKATIQWCSPIVNGCVDESTQDKTLRTRAPGGRVARRVKHFSGYNVVFGIGDDLTGGL